MPVPNSPIFQRPDSDKFPMKNLIFLSLLALPLISWSHPKTVTDILENPEVLGSAEAVCEEDESAKVQCVKDMCQNYQDKYPMILSNDDMSSFVKESGGITTQESKKIAAYADHQIKLLKETLSKLQKKNPEEIIKETDDETKSQFVLNDFSNNCSMIFSKDKPVDERMQFHCPDKLENSKAAQNYKDLTLNYLKKSPLNGFIVGLYTWEEVEAIVPKLLPEFRQKFEKAKKENIEEFKDQVSYLDQNWNKFEKLTLNEKLKFINALAVAEPSMTEADACKENVCAPFYDEYVRSDLYKEQLAESLKEVSSPDFRAKIIASYEVTKTFEKHKPTEKEIAAYNKKKEETLKKIFAYQQKVMSKHSYASYKSEVEKSVVTYENVFEMPDLEFSEDEVSDYSDSDIVLKLSENSFTVLYDLTGTPFNPTNVIVTDAYADPAYKSFDDPNFENPEVFTSLFSYKDMQKGMQIFAHEMGHHLSGMHDRQGLSPMTSETFKKAKSCIVSRYDEYLKSTGKDAGHLYLEEEFADEFSYVINTQQAPVLFCSFLNLRARNDLLSLKIEIQADTHQNDFWRSLTHISHQKKISPACQKVIDQNSTEYKYQQCL